MPVGPYPSPPLATARRLEWVHLPPAVRAEVERRCGTPIVAARSQGAGFTPGFASVLVGEDGSHHFVKAASLKAQRPFAESYRTEARKLAALPASVPAPRLLWTCEVEDWVVLATEYVAATNPSRPWQADDLDLCLDALEAAATALTPAPSGLVLDAYEDDLAEWPAFWSVLRVPNRPERHQEAADLAAQYAAHVRGDTLVHTDIRADNVLLSADGAALFCDWNWPVRGAAWLDSFALLIGPRGDGIDVEKVISQRELLRAVPDQAIDAVLALYTGYFLKSAADPVPPTSPHIRDHQRWQGEVCWEWLCERRGWPESGRSA